MTVGSAPKLAVRPSSISALALIAEAEGTAAAGAPPLQAGGAGAAGVLVNSQMITAARPAMTATAEMARTRAFPANFDFGAGTMTALALPAVWALTLWVP